MHGSARVLAGGVTKTQLHKPNVLETCQPTAEASLLNNTCSGSELVLNSMESGSAVRVVTFHAIHEREDNVALMVTISEQ